MVMGQAERTFDLLSILLDDMRDAEDAGHEEVLQKIDAMINGEVLAVLRESGFPQKSGILRDLRALLNEAEFFLRLGIMAGKTVIGVREHTKSSALPLIDSLLEQSEKKLYSLSTNIPVILYDGETPNHIEAINIHGNKITLSKTNYESCCNIYKHKINIKQLVSLYCVSARLKYKNIVLIYFPAYASKNNQYCRLLEGLTDTFIETPFRDDKYTNSNTEYFSCINNNTFNYAFSKRVLGITSKISAFLSTKKSAIGEKLESVNENIINVIENEIKNELIDIRKKYLDDFEETEKVLKSMRASARNLVESFLILEKYFGYMPSDTAYSRAYLQSILDLVVHMIRSQDWSMVIEYMADLKARSFQYNYVLELYLAQARNAQLDKTSLKRLMDENIVLSSEPSFLIHAKAQLLGDNYKGSDLNQIVDHLKKSNDGYENYFLGNYYKNTNKELAKKYYTKALRLNYMKAGDRLLELVDKNNPKELRILADMLIPRANLFYSKYLFGKKQHDESLINLKIAAALKDFDAISVLANMYFFKKAESEDDTKYQDIAFKLYQYLKKEGMNNETINERLGTLHYRKQQYQKAFELLKDCGSMYAFYYCGRMYQYGNGTVQDLEKARDCLKKAKALRHPKADVEYQKVCGWIAGKQIQKQRPDYRSTSTTETVDDPCFITTAVCKSLGKPDNCQELMILKEFRDTFLIHEPDGPNFVRTYYAVAPGIVSLINSECDAGEIYQYLYDHYISKSCGLILNGNYSEAKKLMVMMTAHLWRKYPVILEDIKSLENIGGPPT
jgi:TPR repeat protein